MPKKIDSLGPAETRLTSVQDLPRSQWAHYFSSSCLKGRASIAVMHPLQDEQREFLGLNLLGIFFDLGEETISVMTESLSHRIERPKFIAIFESEREMAIAVRDEEDFLHVIEVYRTRREDETFTDLDEGGSLLETKRPPGL